jgi:hypothetical protein
MSAATVYFSESNGAGEVVTDNISNLNFGSADSPSLVAASNPIIIGEFSYEKFLRVKVASLGTSTTIKDLRFYKSSGTYVTGESIICNLGQSTIVSYSQPNQSGSHFPSGQGILYPTSLPGSANVAISGAYAGVFSSPGYSNYWLSLLETTNSTPAGSVNQKVFTLQYDET